MVLDGSKEASLPSRGDKPSLVLQQRVTHSIAQWRISGQVLVWFGFFFHFEESKKSFGLYIEEEFYLLVGSTNQMQHWPDFFSSLHSVTLGPLMVSVQRFAQWKYSKLAIPAAIKKK